ncbi:MAG: hypothetical protein QOI81_2243 [Actinomycetota bacterium]|nr:hypothetical protein [Actinomycetota bacterium]
MPLSEHEQKILEEIERRLAEDDPKLVEQVGRSDLYTHLAKRIRRAGVAFVAGFIMLLLFPLSVPLAGAGFVIMVLAGAAIYRYVGQLGRDQLRDLQRNGGASMMGVIGKIVARFRVPRGTPLDE